MENESLIVYIEYNIDQVMIATNGNRYDVNLVERTRTPVYWIDEPNEIRRSKWFYLPEHDSRFIPFDEQMNETLEVVKSNTIHFIEFIIFRLRNRISIKKHVNNNHGIKNMK